MPARIDDLLVLDTAVGKTDLAKYLRDRETVLPSDFGGLGDGVADDRAAIQAAFDRAAADQKFAVIPPGTWNVSAGITLGGGARGLIMHGMLRYTGISAATVLTLGDGGTTRNGEKHYAGLQVVRATQSDWLDEADIGILVRNIDASVVELRLVSGFTIGLRTLGDGRGVEDSTFHLGRILNNRIGLDIHCATATAWNTSIRYYGGHFAIATGINPTIDRFGIRLSKADGAYSNHNRHVFDAPNLELRQLDPNVAIPFLNETSGSAIIGRALRMEACSPIVARHTAAAQDCEYEVAWSNTYQVGIECTATATRCGNTVLNRHRAPASRHLRLLGAVPNVRARAFRHSATEIGVEGLAVIATSTTSATTLAGLSFNGLDDITPTSRGLLLEAQRGLAFVVDCGQAKEFALVHSLVGGADGGRIFVRCFDAAMNVRENVAGDALASITTLLRNVPSTAWTGGAAMADASLNKRMTVRLGPGWPLRRSASSASTGRSRSRRCGSTDCPRRRRRCSAARRPFRWGNGSSRRRVRGTCRTWQPGRPACSMSPSPARGKATLPTRRWHRRRASSSSTPPRGPATLCASWPGTSRPAPPSISARRRCRCR